MMPVEMHYSWIGFVYQAMAWLGQRLAEKLFDIVLVALGTWCGYWFAKRHLEYFVKKLDAKYLDLNRQMAFQRAVTAMLPELPQFYLRPSKTFSPKVAGALAEFTHWSTAIDLTHTPEKSMELVGKEAHTLAAGLIQKNIVFKEPVPIPNY